MEMRSTAYDKGSSLKEKVMSKTKATSTPAVKKPKKTRSLPTQEEIAIRAYQIYVERGYAPGNPLEDWLRAERELNEGLSKPRRKSKIVSIAA
jgi:hypothetical protein